MHFLNSPLLVKVSTSYHIYNFRNWGVINYTHSLLPIYTYVKGCIGVILILKCFLGNLLAMDKLHQILTKHSRVMKQIFQKGDTLPFHLPHSLQFWIITRGLKLEAVSDRSLTKHLVVSKLTKEVVSKQTTINYPDQLQSQRCLQNLVKLLRWNFLRKQLTAFSWWYVTW